VAQEAIVEIGMNGLSEGMDGLEIVTEVILQHTIQAGWGGGGGEKGWLRRHM
jgi:hypothetical protein